MYYLYYRQFSEFETMSSEICFSDCSVLNVTTCEELAPSKLHKVKHFTFYFCITQIAWCNCVYIFVGPSLNNLVSTKMAKYETNILHIQRQAEFNTSVRVCIFCILQESEKGQIFYWSIQTCTRIRLLFDCYHAQKTSKLPYFRLFRPDTHILSVLTALYWPSTAF